MIQLVLLRVAATFDKLKLEFILKMFRAELPSSVSTEFTPHTFGKGTQRHTRDNHVIYEVYADRRKAGTSLRSRILHVVERGSDSTPTTVVMTPGEEYQTIEMQHAGEDVVREIGVNGTHIRMEARDSQTNRTLDQVMLGFQGHRLDEKGIQSSMLPLDQDAEKESPSPQKTEHLLGVVSILPDGIPADQILLLRGIGEVIRDPQQYLSPDVVISLVGMFPPSPHHDSVLAS